MFSCNAGSNAKRLVRRGLSATALVGALLAPALAVASPDYPERLSDELGLQCIPQCTVCHETLEGGIGTATKPFGLSMQINGGLKDKDSDLIPIALATCNSDQDDLPDVEELRQGRDPNVPGAGLLCGPEYGCGARIEPRGTTDWAAVVAAALMALGFVVSRRRARSKR
jgi:hypothetical protein